MVRKHIFGFLSPIKFNDFIFISFFKDIKFFFINFKIKNIWIIFFAVASEKIECTRKEQCHHILGNKSTCKNKRCVCRPFHHLHKEQCVKNKGNNKMHFIFWSKLRSFSDLHDFCEHDHQCYCGQDCVERIGCTNNKCTCREGYKTYSIRRCIGEL